MSFTSWNSVDPQFLVLQSTMEDIDRWHVNYCVKYWIPDVFCRNMQLHASIFHIVIWKLKSEVSLSLMLSLLIWILKPEIQVQTEMLKLWRRVCLILKSKNIYQIWNHHLLQSPLQKIYPPAYDLISSSYIILYRLKNIWNLSWT